MNLVKEITAAVNASSKVVAAVFVACATTLIIEHFYPKEFLGLPSWVLPTIKIIAIFTLVLTSLALFGLLAKVARSTFKTVSGPIRRGQIRKRLLNLSLGELVIVSIAKANMDRTIWYKADMPEILSLKEDNIIKATYIPAFTGDGTSSFEFPEDVWKMIINLDEFTLHDFEPLLKTLSKGKVKYSELAPLLPQAHPKVQAFQQRH